MTGVPDWLATAVSGVSGAVAAFLFARRKFSQDSTGIARDKAETDLISRLMVERDAANANAREAWAQRVDDAKRIARFEALVEAGERETKRLRDEIFALRLHTRKLTAIIVRLDPQASAMLQVDGNSDGIGLDDRREHGPGDAT